MLYFHKKCYLILLMIGFLTGGELHAEAAFNSQQFLQQLQKQWQGKAIHTPLGQRPYNINFEWISPQCITGIANNGFSNHTWTFCLNDERLSLTFLSDFSGNRTSINFNVLEINKVFIIFKAGSHPFMELKISHSGHTRWIKVIHHGELHVNILLEAH